MAHRALVEHATEICVLISLMGAGLAINRPFGRRNWSSTWRLLGWTLPLTVVGVAAAAYGLLGWPLAAALLLGAVLAPTDPVLASDVQVGEPVDSEKADDEVRFTLTSEAGLNDGLAFPWCTPRSPWPQPGAPDGSASGRWWTCSTGAGRAWCAAC